jgi:hypothetical protein
LEAFDLQAEQPVAACQEAGHLEKVAAVALQEAEVALRNLEVEAAA